MKQHTRDNLQYKFLIMLTSKQPQLVTSVKVVKTSLHDGNNLTSHTKSSRSVCQSVFASCKQLTEELRNSLSFLNNRPYVLQRAFSNASKSSLDHTTVDLFQQCAYMSTEVSKAISHRPKQCNRKSRVEAWEIREQGYLGNRKWRQFIAVDVQPVIMIFL